MKKIVINIDVSNPEVALRIQKLFGSGKIDGSAIATILNKGSNNPNPSPRS